MSASAIVHLVAFAPDGVIESAAQNMPGATDAVDKGGNRAPIVKAASGLQRFACGPEASKWWARTDGNGVLHVASGEPERVSCAACKQSKEYLDATGGAVVETGQGDQQGTILPRGTQSPGAAPQPDVSTSTV